MSRSALRWLGVPAAVALAGAALWAGTARPWESSATPRLVGPLDPLVTAAEQARRSEDAVVREIMLTAAPATIDLGDRTVDTWAFNGTVPGPEIRLRPGDVVQATVRSQLSDPLTVHWHGIA